LKEFDEDIKQNAKDVSLLARTLRSLVYDILKLNGTVSHIAEEVDTRLEDMMNITQATRELEFFCLQLEQEFIKIQEGLDVTSTGKLPTVYLPPHNLSQTLQQIVLTLPSDMSLVAGTGLEDMFIYYEAEKFHVYTTSTQIRLLIRIPLRGTDRVMNLYRTEPLPVYKPLLGRHTNNT
jgi:hypothetical protein